MLSARRPGKTRGAIGLLLSLVYRKVTCDISKSKKPFADFSLSFQARSETGANRQRNEEKRQMKEKTFGDWNVWRFKIWD